MGEERPKTEQVDSNIPTDEENVQGVLDAHEADFANHSTEGPLAAPADEDLQPGEEVPESDKYETERGLADLDDLDQSGSGRRSGRVGDLPDGTPTPTLTAMAAGEELPVDPREVEKAKQGELVGLETSLAMDAVQNPKDPVDVDNKPDGKLEVAGYDEYESAAPETTDPDNDKALHDKLFGQTTQADAAPAADNPVIEAEKGKPYPEQVAGGEMPEPIIGADADSSKLAINDGRGEESALDEIDGAVNRPDDEEPKA